LTVSGKPASMYHRSDPTLNLDGAMTPTKSVLKKKKRLKRIVKGNLEFIYFILNLQHIVTH
jgi:hypothetical protein